jgi:hypothetical protein
LNYAFPCAIGTDGKVVQTGTILPYFAGGAGGGAPTTSTYLTLSLDAGLTAERVLTAGAGISFVDTGPNGTLTVSAPGAGTAVDDQSNILANQVFGF